MRAAGCRTNAKAEHRRERERPGGAERAGPGDLVDRHAAAPIASVTGRRRAISPRDGRQSIRRQTGPVETRQPSAPTVKAKMRSSTPTPPMSATLAGDQ
jgi:hypothetical protein